MTEEPLVLTKWERFKNYARAQIGKWSVKISETWPPNRIATVLGPLVLVPASAAASAWLASNFPGLPQFPPEQILAFATAGAIAAITMLYKFLSGWQRYEAREALAAAETRVVVPPEGADTDPSDYEV